MKSRRPAAIVIFLSVTLIVGGLYFAGALQRPELFVYDRLSYFFRFDKSISSDVKIVLIDEYSLKALDDVAGRWPWPRAIWADVLDFMDMAGARAVLFDVLFTERVGDYNDRVLVEATAMAGNVYHSMMFLREEEAEASLGKSEIGALPPGFAESFAVPVASGLRPDGMNNTFYIPFDELREVSKGMAVVEFSPDVDGVYRRTNPLREYAGKYYPVLGLAAILNRSVNAVITPEGIKTEDRFIPTDSEGEAIVNMYGMAEPYSISGIIASLGDIRAGKTEGLLISPDEFKDKIVLIGASAVGVEDLKPTSISPRLPGVMLHAALLSNYMEDDFLTPPSSGATFITILAGAFFSTAAVVYAKRFGTKVAVPLFIMGVYAASVMFLFAGENYLLEFVPFLLASLGGIGGSLGYLTFTETLEKRKVSKLFAQYVSKDVLDQIMEDFHSFEREGLGRRAELTILFSDIRSFTSLSENAPPEEIVGMLNVHFSHMAKIILEEKGTLDKYIGDAIMAFWGAPVVLPDHAERAVRAAIKMMRALKDVNEDLRLMGKEYNIKIGIGLATGPATVGNIGSEQKLNYTVIGDTVNLASRLEGLTKEYPGGVIISEATYEAVKDKIPCRLLATVKVKGREQAENIYAPEEILG